MKAPLVVALLASCLSWSVPAGAVTTVTLSYSGRALIYDGELTAAANRRNVSVQSAPCPSIAASMLAACTSAPVLTRALVYTAITRARDLFVLAGNPAVLEAGVLNAPPRQSGLAERLWPQP